MMLLRVFSKDGVHVEVEVSKFEAASSVGKFEIIEGHAPFVSDILPCYVGYEFSGKKSGFYTTGGLLEFDGKELNLWVADYLNKEGFEKAIDSLSKELQPIARSWLEEN